MQYPGNLEDYDSIRQLEKPLRRRGLRIVAQNLGSNVIGPLDTTNIVTTLDPAYEILVEAARETVERVERTEKERWGYGEDI